MDRRRAAESVVVVRRTGQPTRNQLDEPPVLSLLSHPGRLAGRHGPEHPGELEGGARQQAHASGRLRRGQALQARQAAREAHAGGRLLARQARGLRPALEHPVPDDSRHSGAGEGHAVQIGATSPAPSHKGSIMRLRASRPLLCVLALSLALASRAGADEIQLLNGDRLTGKIVSAEGGKVVIKTESAGDVTVDLSKVKTLSTDEPIVVKSGDTTFKSKLEPGGDGTVQVVPVEGGAPQILALKDLTQLNPPPVKWTGALTLNALVTRGNSESESLGASANAVRRTEIDRITLGAAYYYGRQKNKTTGDSETNVNNWFVLGKYDFFLTKHFYLYAAGRAEGDQVADLDLRLTLGGGVGYQWFETPTFNLNTEAGPAWVYEKFKHQPSENHVALRLAYHVDWTPYKAVKLFHNLEYLPRVTEPFVDYNLNLDAGLRATVIQNFYAEFKFEFKYDSTPAIGARKEDLRYLVGLGWAF